MIIDKKSKRFALDLDQAKTTNNKIIMVNDNTNNGDDDDQIYS